MTPFIEQTFTIPALIGISADAVSEHLKLYAGYVKHANLIIQKIQELSADRDANMYTLGELQRRFGFEFDGMRNHEYYFKSFEGGAQAVDETGVLYKKIVEQWGSFDVWLTSYKTLAMTRGVGWAMLYYDTHTSQLVMSWVDEQHLGQLTGLTPVLALDMWEHSFVMDYKPSGKKQYIEDFFKNINWGVIEKNYTNAIK